MKRFLQVVGIFALLILGGFTMRAQNSTVFWLTVKDDDAPTDFATLKFGNHIKGTYNIDTLMYISLTHNWIEREAPPLSPGFDVRFKSIPGRASGPWGLGLFPYDFRDTLNPARKDTFKIAFQNGSNTAASFTFKWDPTLIASRCDSMIMVVPNLGTFNMALRDSLLALNAGDNSYTTMWIYKYGLHLIDAVKPESHTIPSSFALHGNYPNPFNPSTTIKFDVEKSAFVDIAVYNLLGQRVVTLVSENLNPGTGYTATWNGLNAQNQVMSSGIYFVRMIARTNDAVQYTGLHKLILMK